MEFGLVSLPVSFFDVLRGVEEEEMKREREREREKERRRVGLLFVEEENFEVRREPARRLETHRKRYREQYRISR